VPGGFGAALGLLKDPASTWLSEEPALSGLIAVDAFGRTSMAEMKWGV